MSFKQKMESLLSFTGSMGKKSAIEMTIDMPSSDGIRYGGFMKRVYASAIDSILVLVFLLPFYFFATQTPEYQSKLHKFQTEFANSDNVNQVLIDNRDFIENDYLPNFIGNSFRDMFLVTLVLVGFWAYKSSTPGKMLYGMKIVDATTYEKPKTWQFIVRYVGYIISTIPFGLGFLWVALNRRKRGFHDYLANTVVIYPEQLEPGWQKRAFKRQGIVIAVMLLTIAILYWLNSNHQ